jgi:glycosyltransferase involved in cell wall biosynthesis
MDNTTIPDTFDVTVVIPTRDRGDMLRHAVASVRSQTRPPEQVVVVDDGSGEDLRPSLAREFPEVECIRQPARGVSAARNRGVREARCTWIAFLDSDDEWLPPKLERQLASLRAYPEHAICHTDEIWMRRGRRVNPRRRHAKSGGFIFERCLPLCVISPSSVIIRSALLDALGGFDETLPACEDYDLWLRVCSRYPVLYVDEPLLIKHGGHPDQLSRRYWGMDRFRIQALEKIIDSRELDPVARQAAVRVLIEKIDVYLAGARKRGKTDEAETYEAKRRALLSGDAATTG